MNENLLYFKLVYSSPLLECNINEEIGLSGEGTLSRDILANQTNL